MIGHDPGHHFFKAHPAGIQLNGIRGLPQGGQGTGRVLVVPPFDISGHFLQGSRVALGPEFQEAPPGTGCTWTTTTAL